MLRKGTVRQVAGWQRRQAKERVAGRVGQIPGRRQVGALLHIHLPRPAGRGVILLRVVLGAQVAGAPALGELDRALGLGIGGGQAVAPGQAAVEVAGKAGRRRVVDGACGGDHHRHACRTQVVGLGVGGAGVEKDQVQPALLAQKRGQPARVGDGVRPLAVFQQQFVIFGVAGIVEDGDAVLVALEDLQHLLRRDAVALDDLAQLLRAFQMAAYQRRLLGQVAQITRRLVGGHWQRRGR